MRNNRSILHKYSIEYFKSEIYPKGNRVKIDEYSVKCASSLRLQLFYKDDCICTECGLRASYICLESIGGQRPHFNLYGVTDSGEEVLFTKDHIKPRSKGGKDLLDNLQIMCEPCNVSKGYKYRLKDRIKLLKRRFFNGK